MKKKKTTEHLAPHSTRMSDALWERLGRIAGESGRQRSAMIQQELTQVCNDWDALGSTAALLEMKMDKRVEVMQPEEVHESLINKAASLALREEVIYAEYIRALTDLAREIRESAMARRAVTSYWSDDDDRHDRHDEDRR